MGEQGSVTTDREASLQSRKPEKQTWHEDSVHSADVRVRPLTREGADCLDSAAPTEPK